jgi:hypothetical protein
VGARRGGVGLRRRRGELVGLDVGADGLRELFLQVLEHGEVQALAALGELLHRDALEVDVDAQGEDDDLPLHRHVHARPADHLEAGEGLHEELLLPGVLAHEAERRAHVDAAGLDLEDGRALLVDAAVLDGRQLARRRGHQAVFHPAPEPVGTPPPELVGQQHPAQPAVEEPVRRDGRDLGELGDAAAEAEERRLVPVAAEARDNVLRKRPQHRVVEDEERAGVEAQRNDLLPPEPRAGDGVELQELLERQHAPPVPLPATLVGHVAAFPFSRV